MPVQSDGLPIAPDRTWLPHTPSNRRTITNPQRVTGMPPFTHYIIFTQQLITASHLLLRNVDPFTHSYPFPHHWTQRHTPMPSLHPKTSTIASPHIATRAGDHNLAMLSGKASSSLSSNSVEGVAQSSCALVVLSPGRPNNRITLPSAHVKPKFEPPTWDHASMSTPEI